MTCLEKATALESKLAGKSFLNGNAPGDADRSAFIDLIGKDNVHLWRWVKMLASFTEEERASLPAPKKEGKAAAKSSIILDVKPWDDETDMLALENAVRAIEIEGLHWGASKLLPVAFGVKKLQIMLTIEDALVSSDDIEEAITGLEEYVQSMDIVAWNKV
eukprot:GGOE01061587.1.p2 GENE.GGOE01061587.1~~GGOE01061587.1.p2  ORF type:complete len:161 (-),score=34.95 GGOE01061587.1:184-666(-)